MTHTHTDQPADYRLDDLLYLMQTLRDPQRGCPWDRQQDFRSIAPSTLEEAYEVVDAIESGDLEKGEFAHLQEELGDLLFQVIFYSQLAREQRAFAFGDVVSTLVSKLVRRHPHVFPSGELYETQPRHALQHPPRADDAGVVVQSWESIKQQERAAKGQSGLLADVPPGLPGLTRALKLQKRAAKVGFDWPDAAAVLPKIREELQELEAAVAAAESHSIKEELGDLLFSCVNLARHLKVDPDAALRAANNKFTQRFEAMEAQADVRGVPLETLDNAALEALWQLAKNGQSPA